MTLDPFRPHALDRRKELLPVPLRIATV